MSLVRPGPEDPKLGALSADFHGRVVAVGGTGLVGSHLVPVLQEDCIVHSLSRSQKGVIGSTVIHHSIDLGSTWSTDELPAEVDAVVYLAQSDRFRDLPQDLVHVFTVNTASVVSMMNYALRAGASKFIFASTGGVYPAGLETFSEQTPIPVSSTRDFYAATKLCSEILLEAAAGQIDLTILRVFFAYGRGQREDMLIPRLVGRVRNGEPLTLQGEDGLRLNPVHVSDVVRSVKVSLSLSGIQRINVAGPEIFSLREIASIIGDHLGREPVFDIKNEVPDSPEALVGDISLMSQLLGAPERAFPEGIRDLL